MADIATESKPSEIAREISDIIMIEDKPQFDEQIKSGNSIALFMADWCKPCKRILEDYWQSNAFKDCLTDNDIKPLYVDTDAVPDVATKYGVTSIPQILLFKDGKKVDTLVGALPISVMEQKLIKYLG